jgi:membrane protein
MADRGETSIEVPRPADEVFAYLAGPNDARWRAGVVDVQLSSGSGDGVGTKRVEVRRLLGRTVETPFETVEHEPGRCLTLRRAVGRVRPQVSYRLEPLPTGTRVVSTVSLPGARGVGSALTPLLALGGRLTASDLRRLEARLRETGSPPEPSGGGTEASPPGTGEADGRGKEPRAPARAGADGRTEGAGAGERQEHDAHAVSSQQRSEKDREMAKTTKSDTPEKYDPDRHGDPEPSDPTDLPKRSWFATLKRTAKEFSDDNITDWAAALTYYSVLSFFPALLVLVALLGLVGGPSTTRALMDVITQVAPGGAADTFRPTIEGVVNSRGGAGALFGVGLLGAIWSASGYIGAFFRVSNEIWEIEEGRGPVKLIPMRIIVTIFMLLMVALVVIATVISGPIAEAVGNVVGLGPEAVTAWSIAKWPIILLVVAGLVAFLYYIAPNARLPGFRWVTPGGILAVVLAIVASLLFGVYVANFGKYNATYGTLGGMIVFLLWLWIINNALLFGSELDAEVERSRELHRGEDAEEELQVPPRAEPKKA